MSPDVISYSQTLFYFMLLPLIGVAILFLVTAGTTLFDTLVAPILEKIHQKKQDSLKTLKAQCKLPSALKNKPVHICSHATQCTVFKTQGCALTQTA